MSEKTTVSNAEALIQLKKYVADRISVSDEENQRIVWNWDQKKEIIQCIEPQEIRLKLETLIETLSRVILSLFSNFLNPKSHFPKKHKKS